MIKTKKEKFKEGIEKLIEKKIKELTYKTPVKKTRKSIPKSVKDKVWDTYIGKEKGIGKCYCCQEEIDSKKFDCGHIEAVANGGSNTVENLKPICATCNKSMGTQNLEEFKNQYFSKPNKLYSKCTFCKRVFFSLFITEILIVLMTKCLFSD